MPPTTSETKVMMQENTVATYGWTDGYAVQSHDYLTRPIQETLARLGAHKVLDLGCGNGAIANRLQGQGFDVYGCALPAQARAKRMLKVHVYSRIPLGLRAFTYFVYRYFFQLGFLDGYQGFAFHFLQGFWYRFLVDVKVWEVERRMREDGIDCVEAIRRELGIELNRANASDPAPSR